MKARVLPPEEWSRMEGEKLPPLFPYVSPQNVDIVAVEDDAGKVIACMTVLRATHFEGAWIHPEHRNAAVTKAVLGLASAIAMSRGEPWVFAGSNTEQMTGILGRLGAIPLDLSLFALAVGEDECRKPQ